MKITLADTKVLNKATEIISSIVTEANLKVSKEGIQLVALDPSNVLQVMFTMDKENFTEFDVKESIELGLNWTHVNKVLKRLGKDIIKIEAEDKKPSRIKISSVSDFAGSVTLPLIELGKQAKPINLNVDAEARMRSVDFTEAIRIIELASDHILIETKDKEISIKGKGDTASAETQGYMDTEIKYLKKDVKTTRSKYSSDFINKIIAAESLAEMVELELGTDNPLGVKYSNKDKFTLSFVLAPRVDDD